LAFHEATVEHVTRRADGGTNSLDNCRIACGPCNHSRGTETDPERVAELAARYLAAQEAKRDRILVANRLPPVRKSMPHDRWDESMAALRAAIGGVESEEHSHPFAATSG